MKTLGLQFEASVLLYVELFYLAGVLQNSRVGYIWLR
jgi:hypothetical protein